MTKEKITITNKFLTVPKSGKPFEGGWLSNNSGRYDVLVKDPNRELDLLSVAPAVVTTLAGVQQEVFIQVFRWAHEKLPGEWIAHHVRRYPDAKRTEEDLMILTAPLRQMNQAFVLAEKFGLDLDSPPPANIRAGLQMRSERTSLRKFLRAVAREGEITYSINYLRNLVEGHG